MLGIVFAAVGIHEALAHSDEPLDPVFAGAFAGGVALVFAGLAAIRVRRGDRAGRRFLAAVAVSLAMIVIGREIDAVATVAVLAWSRSLSPSAGHPHAKWLNQTCDPRRRRRRQPRRPGLGRRHRPGPARLHPHPQRVRRVRRRLGRGRAHGPRHRAATRLVPAPADDGLAGATVEVHEIEGRTPLLLVDVPPTGGGDPDDTVLLYGHLDKQPPFTGWRTGLGPWEPVVDGPRLYGRGSADDGYSTFSAITALEAVRAAGGAHTRCVVLIEASEESGSPDLPAHLDALGDRLGEPSLVVALDSWCGDWDHLWITTSLRGVLDMVLRVEVLTEGVHSGSAGGVVPSSFRILRSLLSRIEDERSGELLLRELHVDIPDQRLRQITATAPGLGDLADRFPLAGDTRPERPSTEQMLVARTWQPALEVVGIEGAPTGRGRERLRPSTAVKLSVRVPPTADPVAAAEAIERRLTADPPYDALVTVVPGSAEPGWHAARGAVAGPVDRLGVAGVLRAAGPVAGRRRHDPLHGHARSPVPAGPVRHHRRAGPRVECTWAQRVPASADGPSGDDCGGAHPGRSRHPAVSWLPAPLPARGRPAGPAGEVRRSTLGRR